ncbi:MAG: oxidoreductase [Candidatus Glassbacteria bacterium RIFCSPLOWO2_12_FULL_58_11]|uniref:Oxidoreductase n=1 Tax=Candidatus Glassbacteria bacterium RIFCSPLOWO2_12_FULL_58_11 TaxID=1817867 RepID=A0A1F5YZH3_9BACT|nr:MAG: oxidoreductase [Candidatus Glassbacteria bacterium RIFCSPLOWO2_12_FULL_58_11]
MKNNEQSRQNRREFFKSGTLAAASALAGFSIIRNAYGQSADLIRVGLVGCGGRGTGAAENCLTSAPNIKLVAMADLYKDHLDKSLKNLSDPNRKEGALKGVEVKPDHCFVGFDACKKLLATDVDLVILATPPGFRPLHFEASVNAGKHIFTEKPVAVDPVGIRRFLAAGELAKQKGLAVVAGTQRRHDPAYLEMIKRIKDGQIGEVLAGRVYWNQGPIWKFERQAGWTDMEWQTRNWYYFDWICGDHIVEQHVHNLDVFNWVMGAHPVKALGSGGRQVRTAPVYGNAYDHFTIDYEYPNGVHMLSMCRQWDNCDRQIGEYIVGSKGTGDTLSERNILRGASAWRYRGEEVNPYVQEHTDLIASIRTGKPLNESQDVAESTMTAILGRQSCYTGKEITWEAIMASTLDYTPPKYEFGPLAMRPVPMPGQTA